MSGLVAIASRRCDDALVLASLALACLVVAASANAAVLAWLSALTVGAFVAWIVWQDIKTFTISDTAIVALGIVAFATRWAAARASGDDNVQTLLSIAADAALPSSALFLFREVFYRLRGYDGLGLGDVKLAASGGVLIGAIGFAWALLIASLFGLCFVVLRRFAGKPFGRQDKIAFGAILAPAFWVVWVAEQSAALPALGSG